MMGKGEGKRSETDLERLTNFLEGITGLFHRRLVGVTSSLDECARRTAEADTG